MKNGNHIYALIIAVGIAIGGWFIGNGFVQGRAADRFVTVKGVFVILPRDRAPGIREESQRDKAVRVVSTIQYFLKD